MRLCRNCKKEFIPSFSKQYCSEECKSLDIEIEKIKKRRILETKRNKIKMKEKKIKEFEKNFGEDKEKEIIKLYLDGITIKSIREKYFEQHPNPRRFFKSVLKKYNIETRLKDRKQHGIYRKPSSYVSWHSCEMVDLIHSYHDDNVLGLTLGKNAGRIKLCSLCAHKLGFFSEEIPEWYPSNINETTNLRKDLFEYVKTFPVFNTITSVKKHPMGFIIGKFYSQKNDSVLSFKSGLELKYLQSMEQDKTIVKFSDGPSIKYFDYLNGNGQKERTYFTDFKVWYKDKTIKIIEIKPYSFLITGVDNMDGLLIIPKLEAVESYCKKNDYIFEYWI